MKKRRKWTIEISHLRVFNMLSDPITIFIVMTFGGTFKKETITTEDGALKEITTGKRGRSFMSELQMNIPKNEHRDLKLRVNTKYRGTYADIQKQSMDIQIWSYSRWVANSFLGGKSIPFVNIVRGPVRRSDPIFNDSGVVSCRLNYVCYFQEKWKYRLRFEDIKIPNMVDANTLKLNPSIAFGLGTSNSRSSILKEENNPFWEKLKGKLKFYGTQHELGNQNLSMKIYNNKTIGSTLLIDKMVVLK